MTNSFFGPRWDAPVCETSPQVPVPVGEACAWCEIAIEEADRGFLIPAVLADRSATMLPWHRECFARQTLGSPAHLRGDCGCYGGPRLTAAIATPAAKRAEAVHVWELWTREGATV